MGKLEAEGIGVLAISTEPLEKARETQKATGATFPIAYEVPKSFAAGGQGPVDCRGASSTERFKAQRTTSTVAQGGTLGDGGESAGALDLAREEGFGQVRRLARPLLVTRGHFGGHNTMKAGTDLHAR